LNLNLILARRKSSDEDSQSSQIYLTYDQKDKNKSKYILRLIDLEKLTNLTEFLVCVKTNSNTHLNCFSHRKIYHGINN
jgi:ribosomal silencing factor RsfS